MNYTNGKRIGLRIVLLAGIFSSVSVFAGGDIAEIEAMSIGEMVQRSITQPSLGTYAGEWHVEFPKGGEWDNVVTLKFTVTNNYSCITFVEILVAPYEQFYGSIYNYGNELVYFNGVELGRLTDVSTYSENSNYILKAYYLDVDPSLVKMGVNKLTIVANDAGRRYLEGVALTIRGYVGGYDIDLSASDGEDSYGVNLTWTNVGGPYTLYRASSENGEYRPIKEDFEGNSYTDTDVEYGKAYWYYVKVANSSKKSSVDSGYAKIDRNEPRIKSIKCASLWLTGEGPYNMRLYWNDFNGDLYNLDQITFVLSGGALNRSNNYIALYKFSDQPLPCSFTDIDLTDYLEERLPRDSRHFKWGRVLPNGEHGPYSITAFVSYKNRSNGCLNGTTALGNVNVYFPKYARHGEIANWYRFWPRDGAIPQGYLVMSKHLEGWHQGNRNIGKKFYYSSSYGGINGYYLWGKRCGGDMTKVSYQNMPDLIEGRTYKPHHGFLTDFSAAHGVSRILNGITLGEDRCGGIYELAAMIAHELKHEELRDKLYNDSREGITIIQRPRPSSRLNQSFEIYQNGMADVYRDLARVQDWNYRNKVMELIESGNYVLDSDGDGLSDDDESIGIDGTIFDRINPDKYGVRSISSDYAEYGDNEYLARKAERNPFLRVVASADWAFPGCNIASDYMHLFHEAPIRSDGTIVEDGWSSFEESVKRQLQEIDESIGLSAYSTRNLLSASSTDSRDSLFASSESGRLNGGVFIEEENTQMHPLGIESSTISLTHESGGSLTAVKAAVSITNLTGAAISSIATGYIFDLNDNPVAWARNYFTVDSNATATVTLTVDGKLLSENPASGYKLAFVELREAGDVMDPWHFDYVCETIFEGVSSEDFVKSDMHIVEARIDDARKGNDLLLAIPLEVNQPNDYVVEATLEGTNSEFVCAASVSGRFDIGETIVNLVFDGASIRRSGVDGPYQVPSIRVLSDNEVVAETEEFYITIEYNANDFGVPPTMLLVDGSSWQREDDAIGADGLIDQLRFGIVSTNALPDAVAYRVHAILKGANNYPAAVHSEEVQLAPGENTIMVSFSGSDILSSGVGGPYYVSEVSFSPAGEAGEEAYVRINMEPLEIAEGAFGGKSFTITGKISVTENPGRGIAARVDIPLNVMRVGDVEASLLVIDTNGTCVATFSTNVTISATGEQMLTLNVAPEGLLAYEFGGGEYDIRALVLESANGNDSETIPYACSGLVYRIGEEIFSCEESPDGVAITGVDNAIAGNLVRADIPESICGRPVTGIGTNAFRNCTNLVSVVIPDIIASIGASAFYNCKSLRNVDVPGSVTNIAVSAFRSSGVMSFFVDEDNPTYSSPNGLLLSKDGKVLIIGSNGDVVIPDSVTSIGDYAFDECGGLTSVTIPNSVTGIGGMAFDGCSGLESVTIGNGVVSIGEDAFKGCSGLTSVTIPQVICSSSLSSIFPFYQAITNVVISSGVTSIGEGAFYDCSGLTSVTISDSVVSIGPCSFYDCCSLTKITFMGDAPSVAGNNVFIGVNADCSAYVRIDSTGWSVDIPGTWNGIKIDYLPYETVNVMFNLYPGEEGFESESLSIPKDVNAALFLPTPKRKGHKFIGWFTEAEGGRMIVDGDVLSEDTTLYAHWEELLLLNTGTDNVIWDGTAINESNFDFMIPATEDLPAETVVRINRITFASLNDSFMAWDVDTNKSDPYTVYLNGVKSDAYVFGGTIASNVGTLDNAISYTFSEPCDIVVGKRYPAVKGNNYGTVGNGVALLHSNYGGVLVYGGGADRASVRYVKTGDGNSIMSTPTAKQITGVSGYYPVYEIQYDIVGVAPSGLDKLAFEYTATSANHTIKSIPDGWFKGATRFADETIQKSNLRIGPGGNSKYALQTTASLSPWRDIDARTNAFSFALYADVSAMPSDAKAVMVAIGNIDGYSVILYRESGFVKLGFVDGYGGIVGETAGVEFAPGYHLYMASCDPVSGALTLNVDGVVQDYGAAGGSVALGNGFQIGSVFYGCPYGFSKGANMAIVKMLGYDAELSASDIAALAAEYPAVESLVCNVGLDELDGKTLTVTTNQIARVVVTAEQEREGCEAANIYVKDGGNLVFVDEGGAELTRSRVAADGEMRSLIGSDSLGVKTDGDAVEVVESGGAYIITAVGDGAIDGGALSVKTALDGEIIDVDVNAGYVVKISVDGKSAVLSLRKPEIGYAVGEDDVSSDDNDLSGVLVEVAEEKISAKPTVGDGEVVGALPVKAVRGLYYQAAWGDDLRELHPGEKVQAKDGQLYLGVIKQDGDRGFYRLSVSEK